MVEGLRDRRALPSLKEPLGSSGGRLLYRPLQTCRCAADHEMGHD